MKKSLGFIETRGLVAAIVAADAMLKTADINFAGKEIIDPGIVLIKVTGDPVSVQFAIEAGAAAADKLGLLISSHIIAEPDDQLSILLPELFEAITITSKETSEITVPSSPVPNVKESLPKPKEENNKEDQPEAESTIMEKTPKVKPFEDISGSKVRRNRPSKKTEKRADAPINSGKEPELNTVAKESEVILTNTDDQPAIPAVERHEIIFVSSDSINDENIMVNRSLVKEQLDSIDQGTDELKAPVDETRNQIKKAKSKKDSILTGHATLFDSVNDTIARLKREALGIKEEAKELGEKKTDSLEQDAPKPIIKAAALTDDDLLSLNVHLLRKRARSTSGFPIHGREISKANRQELLGYFSKMD